MIVAGLDKILGHRYNQISLSDMPDLSSDRKKQLDKTSLKCTIEGKSKAFKNNIFFRTHTIWNNLPTSLREINGSNEFQVNLKWHMWDIMIDPH